MNGSLYRPNTLFLGGSKYLIDSLVEPIDETPE